MVDFRLSPEEEARIVDLKRFIADEVLPVQEKFQDLFDHEHEAIGVDGQLHPDILAASKVLRRKSAQRGFYAMHLPQEFGGAGMSRAGMLRAWIETFRHGLGFTMSILSSIEGPNRMLTAMTPAQRAKYLDPMVRGEKTSCFALTEPTAGSDVRNIQATAELVGDHWVLNGTKVFITNGAYADFAQVFAKTKDENGEEGISAFIVDKGTPGFTIGAVHETIANNGLPTRLDFKDCRIPKGNIVGEPGEGFYHAVQNIDDTRIQIGGMCIGLSYYCLDRTVSYVTGRSAFGKPISKFQGVSFPLADCATEITAAEALALYTAWKIDQGEGAIQETSMTKLYTTETLWKVADQCIQAHGGVGVLRETRLERILRWARVNRIFEGTSEIQRQTIAKGLGL